MPRTPPTVISLPAAADHVGGPWDGAQAIVLHHTGGRDSRAWLTRTSRPPVSVHTLIPKDGTVVRIVPDGVNAWHVGGSRLGVHGPNERAGSCNEICFGIEIENLGDGKDPTPTSSTGRSAGRSPTGGTKPAGRCRSSPMR